MKNENSQAVIFVLIVMFVLGLIILRLASIKTAADADRDRAPVVENTP